MEETHALNSLKLDVDPVDHEIETRTTSLGLLNYAVSYWKSAKYLRDASIKVTHPDAPITFLYYQAIELFLKSYLRQKGKTAKQIKNIKHDIKKLSEEAMRQGLFLMDEDKEVLLLMQDVDTLFRSRYITTGAFKRPSEDALERTCKSLYETIRKVIPLAR